MTPAQSPLASVIVPAFNVAATIEETLDALLLQTYRNLEVIVVDDGSSDATAGIVRAYDDPRLRLVQQANRGLAGARNTGIAASHGKYVAFCDADDLWLPEKLEMHVQHLEARPDVGISYSGSKMINEHGEPLGISQTPRLKNITAAYIYMRNPIGNGSAAVIRREALDGMAYRPAGETERDWWFDENFRQSDDIEAWLRFALTLDWKIEGIPGELTLYRIHSGALSANVERQYSTWLRMTERMRALAPDFIAEHGKHAEAYQLRYLARRAVTMGDGTLASRLAWRALALAPRILAEEPVKTITTLGAATLLKVFGKGAYQWAAARVLGQKVA